MNFNLSLIVRAVDQMTGPVRAMRRALGGLQSGVMAAGRQLRQFGQAAAVTGGLMIGAGAAMAAGMAQPVSAAMDFGAAMSSVQAVSNATSEEMSALSDQAKMLGSTTAFSASQAAGGMKFLGQAGFDTTQIMAAMPGVLAAARAGGLDLASTADIASNILSGFGLQAGEMADVADVLTSTFTSANVDMTMLGESMKFVAPIARQTGVSLRQASAMVGILGNAGIQGSMAGTSLAQTLSRLAAPTGGAASALQALGVSARGPDGAIRNMVDVMGDLQGALGGLDEVRRLEFVKEIFGDEAAKSALTLMESLATGELQKAVAGLTDVSGRAQEVAYIMGDNLKGDITALKSAWEGFNISVGEGSQGPLRQLVQSLSETVRGLTEWADKNPELVQSILKWGAIVAAIVAGLGALTLVVGAVASGVGILMQGVGLVAGVFGFAAKAVLAIGTAIKFVGALMLSMPIVAIVAAIAGAAFLIYQYWDDIVPFFAGLWQSITSGAGEIIAFFQGLPGRIVAFITETDWVAVGTSLMTTLAQGMVAAAGAPVKAIQGVVGAVRDYLPFSPAKVGPLSDLDRIQFMETVAGAVRPGPLVKAVQGATLAASSIIAADPALAVPVAPAVQVGPVAANAQSVPQGSVQLTYNPQITIQGDITPESEARFREMLRAQADEVERILAQSNERRARTGFRS